MAWQSLSIPPISSWTDAVELFFVFWCSLRIRSGLIPTSRHFSSRQAVQILRVAVLIAQALLKTHERTFYSLRLMSEQRTRKRRFCTNLRMKAISSKEDLARLTRKSSVVENVRLITTYTANTSFCRVFCLSRMFVTFSSFDERWIEERMFERHAPVLIS